MDGICNDLKEKSINAIRVTIDDPRIRHELDRFILNDEIAPLTSHHLIATTSSDERLRLIEAHYHKKIVLITSGSLDQRLVPRVMES